MNTLKELMARMIHFGPIATMLLVKTITLSTIYCSLMWWPPAESLGGPGYVPLEWVPQKAADNNKMQYCGSCKGYKAPRAHHCRKCGRCVMKMDHHCPWINNCVGHRNHAHFVSFLIFAVIGCSQAAVILSCSLYRAIYRSYYLYYKENVPIVYLGVYGLVWVLFSIGCAVGVVLGVGVLLYYQLKIVFKNQTGIEDWIIEKAEYRRKKFTDLPEFVYPYNLGWKENFKLVMNTSCEPIGDGITWPVRDGCDQHTLTLEQLQQKDDKRKRSKEYVIVEEYSGSWCPISKGIGTLFRPPCSDESRIPLKKDDRIVVTRWKKYWLYGACVSAGSSGDSDFLKGWFPRRCALEIINSYREDSGTEMIPPAPASSKSKIKDKKKKN
ncbi:unnamed protein product [Allacma fusca]|uniref:Palmitoyltransferase n=1 Tax=Allacma fusca TaxID=39272 RepID=A0A8J2JF82_9HEXA|nr:unnamed protein product [Allacma fusca]